MNDENPYAAPDSGDQSWGAASGLPRPRQYASLLERFLGSLIDGLVLLPIAGLLSFVLLPFLGSNAAPGAGYFEKIGAMGELESVIITLILMLVYIGIQWAFWKSSSQSIGKKVMKTQIVNLDGTPTDVKTIAFKRYGVITLLGLIPWAGNLVSLINSLMVFRQERNCLHDDIAKTRVIKLPAKNLS